MQEHAVAVRLDLEDVGRGRGLVGVAAPHRPVAATDADAEPLRRHVGQDQLGLHAFPVALHGEEDVADAVDVEAVVFHVRQPGEVAGDLQPVEDRRLGRDADADRLPGVDLADPVRGGRDRRLGADAGGGGHELVAAHGVHRRLVAVVAHEDADLVVAAAHHIVAEVAGDVVQGAVEVGVGDLEAGWHGAELRVEAPVLVVHLAPAEAAGADEALHEDAERRIGAREELARLADHVAVGEARDELVGAAVLVLVAAGRVPEACADIELPARYVGWLLGRGHRGGRVLRGAAEAVVEADLGDVQVLRHRRGAARAQVGDDAGLRDVGDLGRDEVHAAEMVIVVLELHRPARREGILDAGADRRTESADAAAGRRGLVGIVGEGDALGDVAGIEKRHGRRVHRDARAHPRHTGLAEDHGAALRLGEEADPAGERREFLRLDLAVGAGDGGRGLHAGVAARAAEERILALDAEDPLRRDPLVVAGLEARQHAARRDAAAVDRRAVGIVEAGGRAQHAEMAAEEEARPVDLVAGHRRSSPCRSNRNSGARERPDMHASLPKTVTRREGGCSLRVGSHSTRAACAMKCAHRRMSFMFAG